MSTKSKYRISLPQNHLQRIDRTSPAHYGNLINSVDFIVPHNTPVVAAADCTVTWVTCVKDDFNAGTKSAISELFLLCHNKALKRGLSRYGHLVRNGAKARAGQQVRVA